MERTSNRLPHRWLRVLNLGVPLVDFGAHGEASGISTAYGNSTVTLGPSSSVRSVAKWAASGALDLSER